MRTAYEHSARRRTLLDRYGEQFGHIAGRRQTELALVAARQAAEKSALTAQMAMLGAETANRAKTAFLANMSHELRTPLNAVIGFSEVIQIDMEKGRAGSPKQLEYVRDIHSSANHLLNLLNGILDLAKIEAGRLELREDVFDLGECIAECVALVRERIDANNLTVTVESPEAPITLRADATKVRQVLLNLLSNAAKFTPAGGRIDVRAKMVATGLRMIVSDTGIGISPEQFDNVLSPFGQVENALQRKYDGAGLGLPISKALMDLHGGSLALQSALGGGTKVVLRFPAERVS